ncbi:hypothetical protein GH714_009116 [Hevea brasiliensis]|uniref:CRAL-TRIO domain-containing protein n=1 Tax=Hevea brasiliensis TaxID=3981 RepID=A0A6A6MJE3_HEVBR|nr:hypothetical protein GH714_009116 [Hevea brasiliensis]
MFKSKDTYREIVISRGRGEGEESSISKKSQSATKRTKSILPPIESHWLLPSAGEDKPSSSSNSVIKSMLTCPLKIRDSLKKRSQTLQIVLEGAHDPKDEQLVESFRELLFLEGLLLGKHNDYHTLLRFLRMRDFDLSKAKDTFVKYLKWREDYRFDAIPKEFKFEEYAEVKKCYPHRYHGVDRYGRAIYIEMIGMVDLNTLLLVTTIEKFAEYHVSEPEKTLNLRIPACSIAARRHIASAISILDVKGVGMSNFSKPARYLSMEIQKIDSNYYPELSMVNAESGFRMLWKALRAFLDARTLAKIHVRISFLGAYATALIDALVQFQHYYNLPSFLGGNCTCSEYGGCLFSDKGPWNNPEIIEILQAVSVTKEVCNNGENSGLDSDEAQALQDNGQNKGANATSATEEDLEYKETKFVEKHQAQKIQALEAALANASLVKTTNPKKYCVRPNAGIVLPRSACDVIVTMQAQKESPPEMQCKDKFLLQSVKTHDGSTAKDINAEMASRAFVEQFEPQDKSSEAKALISKLTEEKNSAIQQNTKLRQELELLKRQGNKNRLVSHLCLSSLLACLA